MLSRTWLLITIPCIPMIFAIPGPMKGYLALGKNSAAMPSHLAQLGLTRGKCLVSLLPNPHVFWKRDSSTKLPRTCGTWALRPAITGLDVSLGCRQSPRRIQRLGRASVVYRRGELARHTLDVPAPAGSKSTEEVLTLFIIVDENLSYFIDGNTLNKTSITEGELQVHRLDPGIRESNMKHSINGPLFGNLFGLNLTAGRDASWHVVCTPLLKPYTGERLNLV